jgi:hypothetical protein
MSAPSKFLLEVTGRETDDIMNIAKIIQPLLEVKDEERSKHFINVFVEHFQEDK